MSRVQPTDDSEIDADPFGRALDAVLSAWAEDHELGRDELLAIFPSLGAAIDEVLDLAREIAVVRHTPPPRVPGYDVIDEVGRGGMGIVYRARQHGVDRIVALKVLPESFGSDPRGRSRLLAEARGIGKVRHPHVVTIHGLVETGDVVGYAMEWVEGRSLASLLEELGEWRRATPPPAVRFGDERSERLPDQAVPWFCRLGIAIGRALREVHRHGLVHRDVKPGNVLLRSDGTPLLSDFGLVRAEELGLTRSGQVLGTPAFAAPEQLRSDHDAVGPRSDVFALGATLHCALTGRVPFAGRTPAELIANIDARRRPPLTADGLPRDLETIVARCLEPDPRDRYPTAAAVADDLEKLLALRPIAARPLGPFARGWRLLQRNRRLVIASTLSAIAVAMFAIAVGAWIWRALSLPGEFDAALRAARTRLLEPTHEERVELAFSGRAVERKSAFETAGDDVLQGYEKALAIDDPIAVVVERDIVARARDLQKGEPPRATNALRDHAPTAVAAANAWATKTSFAVPTFASDADRHAFGLLAFLTNRAMECHEAWAPLELRGDAFLDAAAGQMHLEQGEVGKAYARFARATKEWPKAGFLAVAMADCAVRLGDLDVAERELARAPESLRNPWETHLRVQADIRAARGDTNRARELYESVIAHHVAHTSRRHYARMLETSGDLRRALDMRLDLFDMGKDGDGAELTRTAWLWWSGLRFADRVNEFEQLFRCIDETSRLTRLRHAQGERAASTESRTVTARVASREIERAESGLALLTELTRMPTFSLFRLTRPSRIAVASAASIASYLPRNAGFLVGRIATTCSATLATLLFGLDSQAQTAAWTNASPATSNPPARRSHVTAIDPVSGNVLVFGGVDGAGAVLSDFWSWDGTTWTPIVTTPSPVFGGRAVNCPVDESSPGIVLLVSWAGGTMSTWVWNGAAWSSQPSGPTPARASFGMAWDSVRGRAVLHGGISVSSPLTVMNDTWEWDAATQVWANVTPTAPGPARYDAGMAFDQVRGCTVLHGGALSASGSPTNTTWKWDGSTWSQLASATTGNRFTHAMAWDDSRQRLVTFGGANGASLVNSILQLEPTDTWTSPSLIAATPSARSYVPMVFHPAKQQVVMFGGWFGGSSVSNETWTLTTQHPSRLSQAGPGCNPITPTTPSLRRVLGTGPWVGDTLSLVANDLPSPVSILILGFSNASAQLGALGAPTCTLFPTLDILVPIASPTATWTWNPVAGPYGLQFWAQTISLDLSPAAPSFVMAMSNALEITLGSH